MAVHRLTSTLWNEAGMASLYGIHHKLARSRLSSIQHQRLKAVYCTSRTGIQMSGNTNDVLAVPPDCLKGRAVFGTVYGDMHLKDLLGSIVRVGYRTPIPDFYLVLHRLRCRKSTIMD